MKHLTILVISLVILAGAYVLTFGLPPQIAALTGTGDSARTTAETSQNAPGPTARRTSVIAAPLESEPYVLVLRTIGTAKSLRKADVRMTGDGEVTETALNANAMVDAGDVLVRLDDRTQQLALLIAQAELDQARDTVERYRALTTGGNVTIADVTLAEAEVALRLAEANMHLAEVALDDRTITAPISGRLGLSDVRIGDLASANDIIVTIDDTTTLIAEFEVPERSIGLLETGKTVLVGTPTYAGRVFEGRITAFDSRLDSVTRSVTVQAEIDNADGLLWSGMTFLVRMIEETAPLPVVPATAVTWDRSGAGIWTVTDGRVDRIPVTIRYRDGDRLWIETTLAPGTEIVTEGAAKLREGAAITDVSQGASS